MALASYGAPRYAKALRAHLRWRDDGSYEILPFDPAELFGPARSPKADMEERHFDIASSLQTVLEEAGLRLAEWLCRRTGQRNLCLAGGVALNCVMNSRIARESAFERVWVQPAAGDAGTSLGAALAVWADQADGANGSGTADRWRMETAYLGPAFDDAEIQAVLDHAGLRYERPADLVAAVAEQLEQNKVVGWFQGRMEYGPRALGARSILASPIDPSMMQRLNLLKDREDFRPVAPVVMAEEASRYFEGCVDSPFMLFVYDVRLEIADRVPAIRHVDGTARVQTVTREQQPRYYALLERFHQRTGVPVLVNTSFNTRGKPVVCTPQDALECFYTSPIDVLAIGGFLLGK
jgi:carbamoyltransferase